MSPSITPVLFVYGALLRPAMHHPMHQVLIQGSVTLGPAWMRGRLYDVGAFPGAVLSDRPRDRVWGMAFRMAKPTRMLALLDQFEDCTENDPVPHKFVRKEVHVRLVGGREVVAWVYLYNWDVSRARFIANGRYQAKRRPCRIRHAQG